MFSGIIEEKGRVEGIVNSRQGRRLTVESKEIAKGTAIGDSISVDGVCLTVVKIKGKDLAFDVMQETLGTTKLKDILAGDSVNLERPLKAGEEISGHFVTGHIDCVGRVRNVIRRAGDYVLTIEIPKEKTVYVAEKGSIAIDGASLTVAGINSNKIKVCLIPLTLEKTNLGSKKAGDPVNIEFDILSKYSQDKAHRPKAKKTIDADFLKQHGFL